MHVTFVGGGNMATALIGGMLRKGLRADEIGVVEIAPEARGRLERAFGVRTGASPASVAPLGEVVVMAVKPQNMREAAREVGPHLGGAMVLSIAAGIRLVDLARWLGGHTLLARCMPNTPALIGAGITGVFASPAVDAARRAALERILSAVGGLVWVEDEAALDPVTAVSGSGPAYVFYFIEAMQEAGVELGLPAAVARTLALETFRGAAELASRSDEPLATLRARVTSKGGTTERAIASLESQGVKQAIGQAIHAANVRAAELAEELGRDAADGAGANTRPDA